MKPYHHCEYCHKPYQRHPKMNDYTWKVSKFCSPLCKALYGNEKHRMKKTEQARVRRAKDKNYQPTVSASHILLTMRTLNHG